MKYLKTFENHVAEIPRAVTIQNKDSLMDNTIDEELTEEEKKKLIEEDKEEELKRKGSVKLTVSVEIRDNKNVF